MRLAIVVVFLTLLGAECEQQCAMPLKRVENCAAACDGYIEWRRHVMSTSCGWCECVSDGSDTEESDDGIE